MRKVKCYATGEIGNSDEFVKIEGRYYKNNEVYRDMIQDKEFRNNIFHIITKLLGNKYMSCQGLIGKLINESGLNNKIIYESIMNQYDYIKEVISNSNQNDASKIHSIFTIATKRHKKTTYIGCYEIRNNETNSMYIGESIDLFRRFTTHVDELYKGKHHCYSLQNAFNKNHSISDFTITPLFMTPVCSVDKNEIKHESLYLESAFYIIGKKNKEDFYNTKNPYIALKEGTVSLRGYEIDCKKVLKLIYEDKYHVIPKDIHKLIKNDLCSYLDIKSEEETIISNATSNNTDKPTLYRITNLLKDLAMEGIIPVDYNYSKIRKLLVDNNLITIDDENHTIATDYALNNELYIIDKFRECNGTKIYNYYLTEKCRSVLIDIFTRRENKEYLSKSA